MKLCFSTLMAGVLLAVANTSIACGGFFCQLLPIDQAGEQIVFRKDGNQITTMVRIQYAGEAENFGWVLPVPNTPELSLGSDVVFTQLDLATRPQFILERTGEACPDSDPSIMANAVGEGSAADADGEGSGVVIEQRISIGPFDAQVISGDDPLAVASWLADNNFDLSDRGEELLTPYVDDGMKFVVLKLQNDSDVGDIQPIIMEYESALPMIPLRLTAIAAEEDMGIVVWLLSDSRAVPDNFLHVTPNYTRLNWYTGSRNAYASYQDLITEAMDEAGGQGFATDYAGRFENLGDRLTDTEAMEQVMASLAGVSNSEFLAEVRDNIFDSRISAAYLEWLPLPSGQSANIYFDPLALATQYNANELALARSAIETLVQDDIIVPIQNARDVVVDGAYLTRLYTTLSPDEMVLDPVFVFNDTMPDQQLDRHANLNMACTSNGTEWTLTLGEGTGRSDQLVIDGRGQTPTSEPEIAQASSWQIEKTSADGSPIIESENDFGVAKVGSFENDSGGGSASWLLLFLSGLLLVVRRKSRIR
ncbi:MAG: DUF2330 domain-containing protein [Agarilytica sp.]